MRVHMWVVALAALLWSGLAVRADSELNGRFNGIEDAEGAAIEIAPDPGGFLGTFYDRHGNSQDFKADNIDNVAHAVLDMDGRTVLMRMVPVEKGARVTLVPFDPQGRLIADAAVTLGFVREGVTLPKAPEGFAAEPPSNCTRVAAYSFMVSYTFWSPTGVRDGFRCLPNRTRTILGFYPAVRLEIIWKLCQAPGSNAVLAQALRRSSVSCDQVIEGFQRMEARGRTAAFDAEVKKERDALILSIRCAEGYPETRSNCQRAAATLREKATSLRTPAMVLQNYR